MGELAAFLSFLFPGLHVRPLGSSPLFRTCSFSLFPPEYKKCVHLHKRFFSTRGSVTRVSGTQLRSARTQRQRGRSALTVGGGDRLLLPPSPARDKGGDFGMRVRVCVRVAPWSERVLRMCR